MKKIETSKLAGVAKARLSRREFVGTTALVGAAAATGTFLGGKAPAIAQERKLQILELEANAATTAEVATRNAHEARDKRIAEVDAARQRFSGLETLAAQDEPRLKEAEDAARKADEQLLESLLPAANHVAPDLLLTQSFHGHGTLAAEPPPNTSDHLGRFHGRQDSRVHPT